MQHQNSLIIELHFYLVFKALTKYQMLFRHLFYARHVERQLCK